MKFMLVVILSVGMGLDPGLDADRSSTIEFTESAGGQPAPTFRSEAQPIEVKDVMGSVLATTESFRLLTDLTESRLAACKSTRPDMPDAHFDPAEFADRVGSLNLAVFDGKEVNFTFRTTTDGPEYALTVNAPKGDGVQVTSSESGKLVLSATGARLSVTREKTEMFSCPGAADFTIILSP